LVLMVFVVGHLLNLALGLHSVSAMGAWRYLLLDPWRAPAGMALLVGAAAVHTALGLVAVSTRRSLAMSRTDAVQLVLGLLTPPMLITHVVATHVAGEFGRDFAFPYGQMLAVYWSFAPQYAFQQLFVVMIVWIHGALGVYAWLVLLPSWRRIGGIVLPVLFAVPIVALLGFAESGREVLARLDSDPAWKDLIVTHLQPIAAMVAGIESAKDRVLVVYGALVLLAGGAMVWRLLRDRARPVRVDYDGGATAQGRRGLSILEISQAGDVGHAHVCSGRGRCGTCRVQVSGGAQSLSPRNDLEETTLARVHAPPGARLACQARVLGPGVVVTRLLPPHADASAAREPSAWVHDAAPGAAEVVP
jgi:adenylate cyclase